MINKDMLIKNMTENLPVLRAKLELTQDELGARIGMSRSTVAAVETGKRAMTWNTFLSLVLVFAANEQTRKLLSALDIFTPELDDFIKGR